MATEKGGFTLKRPWPTSSSGPGARWLLRLALVFVACVIVVDALVGDRGLLAMMRARRQYAELEATIARDRAENARLREEARRLKEDPTAIEDLARRELGLMKPGEKLFIIRDIPPPGSAPKP